MKTKMDKMNPYRNGKLKGETKKIDAKAMAAGKKAYMASEKKLLSNKKK